MILFAIAGYAATHYLGIKLAFPLAVVLGLILAPLVPAKGACGIRSADSDAS